MNLVSFPTDLNLFIRDKSDLTIVYLKLLLTNEAPDCFDLYILVLDVY